MSDDLVRQLRASLPGIAQAECGGDNLAILLASFFEPSIESDELDDSGTWKQGAIDACDRVLDAIHAHYAQALTEARAEIERLQSNPPLLDARSLPGVDALVKTLEAQVDEALRSCLAERAGRLKAESELSILRARVREVVGRIVAIENKEYGGDYDEIDEAREIARQLMEEVK